MRHLHDRAALRLPMRFREARHRHAVGRKNVREDLSVLHGRQLVRIAHEHHARTRRVNGRKQPIGQTEARHRPFVDDHQVSRHRRHPCRTPAAQQVVDGRGRTPCEEGQSLRRLARRRGKLDDQMFRHCRAHDAANRRALARARTTREHGQAGLERAPHGRALFVSQPLVGTHPFDRRRQPWRDREGA